MQVYKSQIDELRLEFVRLETEVTKVKNTIAFLQKKCNHKHYGTNISAFSVADHYGKVSQCAICGAIIRDE